MEHRFRGLRLGLNLIGSIPHRDVREEFKILIDPYAFEAISAVASFTALEELKGWARSYYTLEGHMSAIYKYRRPKVPEPSDPVWNRTKQAILHLVKGWPRVKSKSWLDFDSVKWLRSSSAGYGYVGLKGDNDNYAKAKRTAVTLCTKLIKRPDYIEEALIESTPDVAFTRTQLSQLKVKRKIRNVWGEAFHYVLLEGLFADNLIDYFIKIRSFYFIGKDPLLAVPTLIQNMLSEYDYVYQFDWSVFDASVQEWEIRFAFELLENILVFNTMAESIIWKFIIELFIYRKVACPNGELHLKTLGIPSGSCFTNMIGSLVNYTRIQFLFLRHTGDFACAYTHGDDSLVGVTARQAIHPRTLSVTCKEFNWEFNEAKTKVGHVAEDVEFLSRGVREGSNFRDEATCLRMLLYPEYPVEDGSISTLRAESILYDSGLVSNTLFQAYRYILYKYGKALALPLHHQRWNVSMYEALRQPYLI